MTPDTETQLTEFETIGQPTSIADIEAGSPAEVLDAFDDVEPFTSAVTINDRDTPVLVGRQLNGERNLYHTYHRPNDPDNHGYAGVLGRRRYPEPSVVAFVPAGDGPDDETVAETIDMMEITTRPEFTELDDAMNQLKTELTGYEEWIETGRADTDWGDWNDAVLSLVRFYDDAYDDPSFTITHRFMKGATMHAIARYPADAAKLMSSASMQLNRLDDSEDSTRYDITPFALETLLLDYAAANVDAVPADLSD